VFVPDADGLDVANSIKMARKTLAAAWAVLAAIAIAAAATG
jgi:hypothetical protein